MMQELFRDGSMLAKITAGVTIFIVVSMLGFGMRLYAGQQDRHTGSDAARQKEEILSYVEEHYSRTEFTTLQYQTIIDRLDSIDARLERMEREK